MNVTSDDECPECGEGPVEIMCWGDPEPTYMPGCYCWPIPRCPSCRVELDEKGKCANMDCPCFGAVVPIPTTSR